MPSWYLLWALVDDIPSVARIVRILPGPAETSAVGGPTVTSGFSSIPSDAGQQWADH
ncbi:MAG: hypothetical protein IPL27_09555 [Lewinellaceae bacterium]|nr:hypothetical protein [Lewinellaceae bacterium]